MSESAEKVVALTNIPRGVRSVPFRLEDISGTSEPSSPYPIQVGIWTSGEIQPLNTSLLPIFWPKLIKFSPDCHVQNVRISRYSSTQVVLQAIKDIHQGQELLVWFGEDLLVDEMGIPPYLSPTNIRAGNSYVCQDCGQEFEAPNPLKIHVSLKCDSLTKEILWTRLSSTCNKLPLNSSFKNYLPRFFPTKSHNPHPLRPFFITPPPTLMTSHLPVSTTFQASSLPTFKHHTQSTTRAQPHQALNNNGNGRTVCITADKTTEISDPHAQLESIVSNMGKARNGHMCLYCGKLYSRKYGLKIHIRTHTGYKPLRCRICHRPFGDPSNLNKHIRLHSDGNTPYRCDICQKVLVRKRDLERHIRSRHANTISDGVVLDCTLNGRTPSSTVTLNGS